MPLNCEINIEKNAPVRLLNAVMERMDYSKLYAAYSRLGKIEHSSKILLKITVYEYMRRQISIRALKACCRKNLHFISSDRNDVYTLISFKAPPLSASFGLFETAPHPLCFTETSL